MENTLKSVSWDLHNKSILDLVMVIMWTYVERDLLCVYMVSPGHNELVNISYIDVPLLLIYNFVQKLLSYQIWNTQILKMGSVLSWNQNVVTNS